MLAHARRGEQVVQYVAYMDGQDEYEGHGTHVTGTAVGNLGSGWGVPNVDTCGTTSTIVTQVRLEKDGGREGGCAQERNIITGH